MQRAENPASQASSQRAMASRSASISITVRIRVISAGPHGLTSATRNRAADSDDQSPGNKSGQAFAQRRGPMS